MRVANRRDSNYHFHRWHIKNEVINVGRVIAVGDEIGVPILLYPLIPEFWAGCQWTLRVAAESQHKKKATVTRQLEKALPLFSCIPFAPGPSLDAVNSLDRNCNL